MIELRWVERDVYFYTPDGKKYKEGTDKVLQFRPYSFSSDPTIETIWVDVPVVKEDQ